jgi:uncharacterized membrane protein
MKAKRIKTCELCGERPGINYDGRYICIACWKKTHGR